jgi:hypothetical protein
MLTFAEYQDATYRAKSAGFTSFDDCYLRMGFTNERECYDFLLTLPPLTETPA